jgi:hypothetical protein
MTGYTVNTGTSMKFSEGWDRIFGADTAGTAKKKKATAESQPIDKAPAKAKPGVKKSPAAEAGTTKAGTAKTVRSKQAAQTTRTSGKR